MRVAALLTYVLSFIAIAPLAAQEEGDHKESCERTCSMELYITFFPPPFVGETLEKYHIDSEKRAKIMEQLSHHELDINSIVDSKAVKMTPNPLNQPDQQDDVIKLYDEAVLQVFTQVMNDNGITDKDQIAKMLDEIHKKKAEHFRNCMTLDLDSN